MKNLLTARNCLVFIIVIVIAMIIFSLTSCLPSRETCQRLYPVQYKDSTYTKIDSIKVPYFVYLHGDTIRSSGIVNRPCPDSIKQWKIFEDQLNYFLNQNQKYKQTIDFNNNVFTSELKIKGDSLLKYKTLYTDLVIKTKTNIMPVVSYVDKTPSWAWWLLGITGLLLGSAIIGIILKFAK